DYVVRIRGQMRQAEVFAENLELSREISTVLGERSIHIRDRIENLAVDRSPLMFVYHCNPGFPLLDEGTRLVLHSRGSTEWTEDRPVGPEEYTVAKGPQPRAHDDVYVHRPHTDHRGRIYIGLLNENLGLGLYWQFKRSEIPIVNQWQHFHKGTYVTGIEPGNCSVLGRAWNRKHGTLQYIEPGEVREFNMEIGVLDGADQMREFERKVEQGLAR
ncbi:MAG: DUF4432 family protein, partial [Gemmatimonadetes bacterium]|nr:DUF4432 family protein [Gemmatimonadota bacterium]